MAEPDTPCHEVPYKTGCLRDKSQTAWWLSAAVGVVKLDIPANLVGLAWRAGPELPIVSSHRHAELEINLVMRGSATYLFSGRRDRLVRRSLLWLWPGHPSRLGRVFKAQMGVSLREYRNQLRLERFLQVHGNGARRTVTRSLLEAGFGSQAQFYRAFRAAFGTSPSRYLRGETASGERISPLNERRRRRDHG